MRMEQRKRLQVRAMFCVVIIGCCFTLNAHAWTFDDSNEVEELLQANRDITSELNRERDLKLLSMLLRIDRSNPGETLSQGSDRPLPSSQNSERSSNPSLMPLIKRQRPCFWNIVSCY